MEAGGSCCVMAFPVNEKKHLSSGMWVDGMDRSICAACGPVTPDGSAGMECVFNE